MNEHHNQFLGNAGEELAAAWFKQQGFTIIARNWRSGHAEVDIIASKDKVLHFIEVKTRLNGSMANPEDSVGKTKKNQLKIAAEAWLYLHPEWKEIQFDVLALEMSETGSNEFILFADIM